MSNPNDHNRFNQKNIGGTVDDLTLIALRQKIQAWGQHTEKAEMLRKQIEEDMLRLRPMGGIEVDGVKVIISSAPGSTDYHAAAMAAMVSEHYILPYQQITYDWKAICRAAGVSTDIIGRYYTPGKEIIKITRK